MVQSLGKNRRHFPIIGKAALTVVLMMATLSAWAATGWYQDYVIMDVNDTAGAYYWI